MLTGARFFHQPNYEPDVLNFAEDIKMPFGVAELFTFPQAQALMASSRFSGPVLVSQHITICFIPEMLTSKTLLQVFNTEFDFGACGGYCPGLESSAEAVFTGSKKLVTATHPGGGHGMNFGKNATGAYGVMIDFVKSSGF